MPNIIGKKFNIKLNAKEIKPVRDKSQVFYNSDSAILNIQILEDSLPKDLLGCTISVLYSAEELKQPIQQKEKGIRIIDDLNGLIEIKIPDNAKISTNMLSINITISDLDEDVCLQPIIFTVKQSINNEVVENEKGTINSIMDIDRKIEELGKEVLKVEDGIEKANTKLSVATNEISTALTEMNNSINSNADVLNKEIDDISNRINNVNNELNETFMKSIKLSSIINGNYISFETDFINKVAKECVKYSFIVHTSANPYANIITSTAIGILTFTLEGERVNIKYNSLIDHNIQGNMLQVNASFSNGLIYINKDEFGYKLRINCKGKKEFIEQSNCVLTPISSGLI